MDEILTDTFIFVFVQGVDRASSIVSISPPEKGFQSRMGSDSDTAGMLGFWDSVSNPQHWNLGRSIIYFVNFEIETQSSALWT